METRFRKYNYCLIFAILTGEVFLLALSRMMFQSPYIFVAAIVIVVAICGIWVSARGRRLGVTGHFTALFLGIVYALLLASLHDASAKSKVMEWNLANQSLDKISSELNDFMTTHGECPKSAFNSPPWPQHYADPFGNGGAPYDLLRFAKNEQGCIVYSLGLDGDDDFGEKSLRKDEIRYHWPSSLLSLSLFRAVYRPIFVETIDGDIVRKIKRPSLDSSGFTT